jgi:hypothetical protein
MACLLVINGLYYKHITIVIDATFINMITIIIGEVSISAFLRYVYTVINRTSLIIHQCMKTNVLSCHRCLIKTGVEKMNNI